MYREPVKRLAVLLAVVVLAVLGAGDAEAKVQVSVGLARHMANDYLAWEKREGYTTSYRVYRCYGHLTEEEAGWLPTWGVKAYCHVYQDWADPRLGEGTDTFQVSAERVGRGAHRRCRLSGGTYVTIEGTDTDGSHYATPEHYIYRPCPRTRPGTRAHAG